MGGIEIGSPPARNSSQDTGRLTVMILGQVGKVRSFKISARFAAIACLFFALYMSLSVWIIYRYSTLLQDYAILSKKTDLLEGTLSDEKRNFYKAKQHLALLEDYIERLQRQEKNGTFLDKDESSGQETEELGMWRSAGTGSQEENSDQIVGIKDLVIQNDGQRISVNFKLVNLQSQEKAVGGYVHMIARKGTSDPPQEWTYPRERIRNGIPENYRRGQLFLIQRFKPIYGKFNLKPGSERPSAIKIMIFDKLGAVILDREFEVTNGS
jgi:hypothetical protein